MRAVELAIGVGWLAFWLYWVSAAVGVKAGRSHWQRFAGIRLVIALVVLSLARIHAFRGHTTHDPWLAGIGLVVWALGLSLAIWARIYLGRNWGTPMSEKTDPELVTTGPYRWVRNPIYSGLILGMIGTAIAVTIDWLAVTALLAGYFVYSAFMEQRFMAERFPDTYPPYKRATKMLVPFVF
jgi:protein-S-isoprenylcysteine O-methyltransferase Ste14